MKIKLSEEELRHELTRQDWMVDSLQYQIQGKLNEIALMQESIAAIKKRIELLENEGVYYTCDTPKVEES